MKNPTVTTGIIETPLVWDAINTIKKHKLSGLFVVTFSIKSHTNWPM